MDNLYERYFPRSGLAVGILIGTLIALILTPSIEYWGDISNIVDRAYLISQGASPLRWPDPPLRYLPISALMYVLVPLGVSPKIVATGYTIGIEFVLVPIMLFRAVRVWWNEYVAGWSTLLYGPLAFVIFPDIIPNASPVLVNTMYLDVFWMYSFAIPPILFAWEQVGRRNYRLAGIGLGIVALLELPMAALAALVVALTGLLSREYRGVAETALVSMVIALPLVPFAFYHLDYWLHTGASRTDVTRYELFNGGTQAIAGAEVTVLEAKIAGIVIFGIGVGLLLIAYRRSSVIRRFVQNLPPVVKSQLIVLGTLEFVLGVLFLALWYHILIAYIFRFTLFAILGLIASLSVDHFLGTV